MSQDSLVMLIDGDKYSVIDVLRYLKKKDSTMRCDHNYRDLDEIIKNGEILEGYMVGGDESSIEIGYGIDEKLFENVPIGNWIPLSFAFYYDRESTLKFVNRMCRDFDGLVAYWLCFDEDNEYSWEWCKRLDKVLDSREIWGD